MKLLISTASTCWILSPAIFGRLCLIKLQSLFFFLVTIMQEYYILWQHPVGFVQHDNFRLLIVTSTLKITVDLRK